MGAIAHSCYGARHAQGLLPRYRPVRTRSYTHFCRCGKQLDSALEAAGAKRLAERVDVNKEDWPVVDAWLEGVVAAVRGMALKSFVELGLGEHRRDGARRDVGCPGVPCSGSTYKV